MTKGKQKTIPMKNYVLLGVLAVVTCFILVYFVKWYRMREQEQLTRTLIISAATEIRADEINNYLLENPDVIVYLADSTDETLTSFENTFENYLSHKDLITKMIYVDTSMLTEKESQMLQDKWFEGQAMTEPNFLIILEGKKVGQVTTKSDELKLNDVHQFFVRYEVVE